MFKKPEDAPPADDQATDKDGDDSAEQDDSEDGDDASKGSDKGGLFFDPNKLPEELKPAFKKMQASFTKKMQAAGLSVRKAQAFDELAANPEFQAWVQDQENKGSKGDKGGESGPSKADLKDLDAIVERAVTKGLAPIIRRNHQEKAQQEWNELLEVHPEADNYKDQIREAMQEAPGLSYAKAFKMVAFDDAVGERTKRTHQDKKDANTSKDSKVRPGEKPPGQPKTIMEAYQSAKKTLAGKR